ncbi:HAD family phosphatase [Rurimicrobium arvi]|uniref:HAD family phosphatase n=1 Tax=Rurimicrobium arvi TaxID=2049916 RepID=A0ABP8MFJ5_9BACT
MIEGIRHIVFDLGNVLLNIDPPRTETAFKELIPDTEAFMQRVQSEDLFRRMECGAYTPAEFTDRIRHHAGIPLHDEQIHAAWNALLLDFPLRRLQILQQLSLYHDLVLLSNTNEIHEAAFNATLQREHGMPNLGVFFDRVYYSHRVGLRKPDTAIYQLVLDECGFDPAKTLFIDDLKENIAAAESLGIRGIWLEPGMTIEEHIFLPKQ